MTNENSFHLPGLDGKRVAISAGAGGIGYVFAKTLMGQGARVAVFDIDAGAVEDFSAEFPDAIAMVADVTREDHIEKFFAEIQSKMGGLDALINNAGAAGPTGRVEDIKTADWETCLQIGLTSMFLCTRLAVPMLRKSKMPAIINMSSVAGKYGYSYRSPYSSAKFGVIGFTQSMAKELGGDNIRVNAILPGMVSGPRTEGVIRNRAESQNVSYEEMVEEYLSIISMHTLVDPQDVANMAVFLLSDMARFVTGQSIAVDGNVETLK